MRKVTEIKDTIINEYNEILSDFKTALMDMNESCIEFVDNVDAAKSNELMDSTILKKKMKDKIMEVLTDD